MFIHYIFTYVYYCICTVYIRSFSWHVFREQVSSSYNHATSHDNMQFLAHSNGVSMARTTGWSSLGQHGLFFDELRPDLTLKGFPDPKMSIEFWVRMVEIAKSKLEKRGMGFLVPVEGRTEIRQRKMFWMMFFLWTSRDKKSPKRNPPNHKENIFSTNFGEVNQISSFLWVNCWTLEISTPQKKWGSNISRIWFALLKFTFAVSPWAGFSFTSAFFT